MSPEMTDRFPLIPAAERTPAQRVADDMLREIIANNPPNIYKDENGCFVGPYAVLMYNPNLLAPWIDLAAKVSAQSILTPREKELVVLAVKAAYDAPFILYAHTLVAKRLGLSEAQITSAANGEAPSDLTDSERVAYLTALELAESRKPLSEAGWERALEVLGRERTAGVAHLVGGYVYVVTLLNVGAIGAPEQKRSEDKPQ